MIDVEAIFGDFLEEIPQNKYKNIHVKIDSLIGYEEKLAEILKQCDFIERVFLDISTKGNDNIKEHINSLMKKLTLPDNSLCIDPKKIFLIGDFENIDCPYFFSVENIILHPSQTQKIDEFLDKFPNLKNIEMPMFGLKTIRPENVETDIYGLLEEATYAKIINLEDFNVSSLQKMADEMPEFAGKFLISDNGGTIINKEKIMEESINSDDISINFRDFKKLDKRLLKGLTNNKISIVIKDVSELSCEDVEEIKKLGMSVDSIIVYSFENDSSQNEKYDLDTYSKIRTKLDELVEDIDDNLPEKEKFAQIYKRVCKSIVYDIPAGYPKSEKEEKYERAEYDNSRNLKNGVLKGKCVCAGYADILRNALALKGIEARYVGGETIEKVVKLSRLKEEKCKGLNIRKDEEKGIAYITEGHAWNKVKLDGNWFNVDATWDANRLRNNLVPLNCFKTDEQIEKYSKKIRFNGPECVTEVSKKEIEELFSDKHKYIGEVKIPTVKDIVNFGKDTLKIYKDIGSFLSKNMKRLLSNNNENKIFQPAKSQKKLEESKRNSWDLRNWNQTEGEFLVKAQKAVSDFEINESKKEIKKADVSDERGDN